MYQACGKDTRQPFSPPQLSAAFSGRIFKPRSQAVFSGPASGSNHPKAFKQVLVELAAIAFEAQK